MAVSEQAFLMVLAGLSGSGKTTIADHVAKELSRKHNMSVVVLDSDPVRKDILGVPHTTRLGEDAYAWDITKKVIAEMDKRTTDYLSKSTSVILTSILVEEAHRKEKQNFAENCHVPFIGLWLDAPEQILLQRVEKRSQQNTDASDANVAVVKKQIQAQESITDWPKINSDRSVEDIVQDVIEMMPLSLTENRIGCG